MNSLKVRLCYLDQADSLTAMLTQHQWGLDLSATEQEGLRVKNKEEHWSSCVNQFEIVRDIVQKLANGASKICLMSSSNIRGCVNVSHNLLCRSSMLNLLVEFVSSCLTAMKPLMMSSSPRAKPYGSRDLGKKSMASLAPSISRMRVPWSPQRQSQHPAHKKVAMENRPSFCTPWRISRTRSFCGE